MGLDGAMRRCLIVDDSEVIRRVARRIIEGLNFSVEEAGDGRQALDRCRGSMPEAILLDWSMPNMDGMEFLRALRSQANGKHPVVVFCSSENDPQEIAEMFNDLLKGEFENCFERVIMAIYDKTPTKRVFICSGFRRNQIKKP